MFVGSGHCNDCVRRATHQLLPCCHTVCTIHVQEAAAQAAANGTPRCAVCSQHINSLVGAPLISNLASNQNAGRNLYLPTTPTASSFAQGSPPLPSTSSGSSPITQRDFRFSPLISNLYRHSSNSRDASGWSISQPIPEDPFATRPVSSAHTSGQSTPGAGDASGLAGLIKNGGLSDVGPLSGRRPGGHEESAVRAGNGNRNHVPVVRHWGSHLDEMVPDPPFMIAYRNKETLPSLEDAVEHQPFTEPANHIRIQDIGVVKVVNIPFTCTKPEILAALGRSARVIHQPAGSPFYAIHIIMDRATGKTNDCYVEIETRDGAQDVVNHYHDRRQRGRPPKVGDRHVTIELSDIQTLMRKMFPKASCVQWHGMIPVPHKPAEEFNSGFRGFLMIEECSQLKKHAEDPKRSPFVNRSSNRVYEATISLVHKYPWYKPELITIGERATLFKTVRGILALLISAVNMSTDPSLTPTLVQELICAIVTVGFSHTQKNEVVELAFSTGFGDAVRNIGYMPMLQHSTYWPFQVLDKKKGVGLEVFHLYASLFHLSSIVERPVFAQKQAADTSVNPFGALQVHYPGNLKHLDLAKVAQVERDFITRMLQRILKQAMPTTKAAVMARFMVGVDASAQVGQTGHLKSFRHPIPVLDSILKSPAATPLAMTGPNGGVALASYSPNGIHNDFKHTHTKRTVERPIADKLAMSRWSQSSGGDSQTASLSPTPHSSAEMTGFQSKRGSHDFPQGPGFSWRVPQRSPTHDDNHSPSPQHGAAVVASQRQSPSGLLRVDSHRNVNDHSFVYSGSHASKEPNKVSHSPLSATQTPHPENRSANAFRTLGAMPIHAVLGRTKDKRPNIDSKHFTRAEKSSTNEVNANFTQEMGHADAALKTIVPVKLNPGATAFTSPKSKVGGHGQSGEDDEVTFRQFCDKAGIKISIAEDTTPKRKGDTD